MPDDQNTSGTGPPPSDRAFAPKPAAGPVMKRIAAAKTDAQRRAIRHAEIIVAARQEVDGEEWTITDPDFGEVTFLIQDPRVGQAGLVECDVIATLSDGSPVPGLDNPHQFDGLSVTVPTGTWREEEDPNGEAIEVENVIEDVPEAFRRTVAAMVLNQARRIAEEG